MIISNTYFSYLLHESTKCVCLSQTWNDWYLFTGIMYDYLKHIQCALRISYMNQQNMHVHLKHGQDVSFVSSTWIYKKWLIPLSDTVYWHVFCIPYMNLQEMNDTFVMALCNMVRMFLLYLLHESTSDTGMSFVSPTWIYKKWMIPL